MLDHVGRHKMTARPIRQPGRMDKGQMTALVKLGQIGCGGMQAEIDMRIGTVGERVTGVGSIAQDAQSGAARCDEIGIIGW